MLEEVALERGDLAGDLGLLGELALERADAARDSLRLPSLSTASNLAEVPLDSHLRHVPIR